MTTLAQIQEAVDAAQQRAPGPRRVRVYISGPAAKVTGIRPRSASAMRTDLLALLSCDAIHMLPGWRESKGATVEHAVAVACGMPVTFAAATDGEASLNADGSSWLPSNAHGDGLFEPLEPYCGPWPALCDECARRDEAETRIESLSLAKEPTP